MARNEQVVVGAASLVLSKAPQDNKRVAFVFKNTGATTITIVLGIHAAVDRAGIVLGTNEYYAESNSESFKAWQGQINTIGDAGAGSLSVMERFEGE